MEKFKKLLLLAFIASIMVSIQFTIRGVMNIKIEYLFFALIFLIFLFEILLKGKINLKFFDKKIIFLLLGLMIYALILLPYQKYHFRTLVDVVQLFQLIILAFILTEDNFIRLSKKDIEKIIKLIFYVSFVAAIYALVYSIITGNRFIGGQFKPLILTFGFFYSFYYLIFSKKKWRYLPLLLLFLAAIVVSQIRSLWIITPLSVIVVLFFCFGKLRKKTFQRLVLFLLFCIFLITILGITHQIPTAITERAKSIFTGEQSRDVRPQTWLAAIKIFQEHPLGVGLGNFEFYSLEFTSPFVISVAFGGNPPTPHSDWFRLLAETGIIGFILYFLFWARILKKALLRRFPNVPSLIMATFLVSIFLGTFVSEFITSAGSIIILSYYLFLRTKNFEYEKVISNK